MPPKPDYRTKNLKLVGYSDQDGRCDGVQIMVHKGFAYVGHIFSKGFSVIDVRNPKKPKTVRYVAAPPNTWTLHLQAHDDLLLVINAWGACPPPCPPCQADIAQPPNCQVDVLDLLMVINGWGPCP